MPLHALLALLLVRTAASGPSLPSAFAQPPILMYHRVDTDRPKDPVGRQLTVSPQQLQAQLSFLKRSGIAAIDMAQLAERLERGSPLSRTVVLTFDDGYADQYRYAVPLLRRYSASASFYIVTGEVGRLHHMTWSDLTSIRAQHFDVGAHGVLHDDLSRMSAAQQYVQILGSLNALRDRLHAAVATYAYPSGRFNRTTLEIVKAAQVTLALTTDPSHVIPPQNRFELTRVRVRSSWSLRDFARAVRRALLVPRVIVR